MLCPGIGTLTVLGKMCSGEGEGIHLPLSRRTGGACSVEQAPVVLIHSHMKFIIVLINAVGFFGGFGIWCHAGVRRGNFWVRQQRNMP